ncbi:hypothetical protein [Prosthecobacter sp.]|uniref:hypothetical protein n=1 Tax=Prosthecobacter sp. TaxID=1965333 RepID=UPI003783E3FF
MLEPEPLNPYTAPKAASAYRGSSGANLPRRPASVKWAVFCVGLFTLILGILYWQAIKAKGAESIWRNQSLFDPSLLLPLGLALGMFGGRRKIAYYGIAIALALLALKACYSSFVQWSAVGAFARPFLGQRFMEALMSYAMGYLFYRFTFGLPSRRYFGLI